MVRPILSDLPDAVAHAARQFEKVVDGQWMMQKMHNLPKLEGVKHTGNEFAGPQNVAAVTEKSTSREV